MLTRHPNKIMKFQYRNNIYKKNIRTAFFSTILLVAALNYFSVNVLLSYLTIVVGLAVIAFAYWAINYKSKFAFQVEDNYIKIRFGVNEIDFLWIDINSITENGDCITLKIDRKNLELPIYSGDMDNKEAFMAAIKEKVKKFNIKYVAVK